LLLRTSILENATQRFFCLVATKMEESPRKSSSEGVTIIPPSMRPDGSMRKAIRVRAGYVPQDEVRKYEAPGRRRQKQQEAEAAPPGWDEPDKSTTQESQQPVQQGLSKAQKRNLQRKKKKQQETQTRAFEVEEVTTAIGTLTVGEGGGEEQTKGHTKPTSTSNNNNHHHTTTNKQEPEGVPDRKRAIRAVEKRLREIEALQAKVDEGIIEPDPQQLDKLKKKDSLLAQLEVLKNEAPSEEQEENSNDSLAVGEQK